LVPVCRVYEYDGTKVQANVGTLVQWNGKGR